MLKSVNWIFPITIQEGGVKLLKYNDVINVKQIKKESNEMLFFQRNSHTRRKPERIIFLS